MQGSRRRAVATWARRAFLKAGCMAAAAALAACASSSLRPAHLPLGEMRVIGGPEPMPIDDDAVVGKGQAAAVGALGAAASVGLLATLACLPTGFLLPACLGVAVPSALAAGAVGGAVAGAVMVDAKDVTLAKLRLVDSAVAAAPPSAALATTVRRQVGAPAGVAGDEAGWLAEVSVLYIGGESGALDKPFQLRLNGALTLKGPVSKEAADTRSATPSYMNRFTFASVDAPLPTRPTVATKRYETLSDRALTLDAWQADGSQAVRAALEAMVEKTGARMAEDLR